MKQWDITFIVILCGIMIQRLLESINPVPPRQLSDYGPNKKEYYICDYIGTHEGDFERVTVYVSVDLSTVIRIFYSAHGDEILLTEIAAWVNIFSL